MTLNRMRWIGQGLIAIVFLSAFSGIGHLAWTEIFRLAIIVGGLVWIYLHNRENLGRGIDESSSTQNMGTIVLVLVTAFTMTQFDPATVVVGYHELESPFNVVNLVGLLSAGGLLLLAMIGPSRSSLNPRLWTRLDRTILGVVLTVFLTILLSQQIIVGNLSQTVTMGALKVLGYGCLWLGISRLYSQEIWGSTALPTQASVPHPWRTPFFVAMFLFVPALLFGVSKVVMVFYYFDLGQTAFVKEDYASAKSYYAEAAAWNQSIRVDQLSDQFLSDIAVIHFLEGDEAAGFGVIKAIREPALDDVEADLKSADVYFRSRMWPQVVQSLESVLAVRGKDVRTLDKLGQAYLELRDVRSFLRRAERFNHVPDVVVESYEEVIFLGNVHSELGRHRSAGELYERALAVRPGDSYAGYKVGRALQSQGRVREAMRYFNRSKEQSADFADAYFRIGQCLEELGDSSGAVMQYQTALDLLPNHLDGQLSLKRLRSKK